MVKEVLDKNMRATGLHSSEEDALRTLELALAASLSGFRKTSMATCERVSSCVVRQEEHEQQGGGSKSTLALKKAPCVLSWVEGEGSGSWQCLHCGRKIKGDYESMALRRVGEGRVREGLSQRGFSVEQVW